MKLKIEFDVSDKEQDFLADPDKFWDEVRDFTIVAEDAGMKIIKETVHLDVPAK